MTRFKLNIVEMLCQAIALMLLFLPGMYTLEVWEPSLLGYWLKYSAPSSFFLTTVEHSGIIAIALGFTIAVLMVGNLVLILLTIFKSDKYKNGKGHTVLPLAVIILMVVFSLISAVRDEYGYCSPINWLFYIEMFVLLATSVIAFIKCSPKIEEESKKVRTTTETNMNSTEEIKKYKELLDSNIITQEEFDAKKKQLLGL